MQYKEGGYEYVFMKTYQRSQTEVVKKDYGQLTLQLYDNGVQIRTLATANEVSTLVNRDVAVDEVKKKIYILEPGNKVTTNPDGSLNIE
jgi:acyl CoA:acetate/3-ketoacid CoA transferase alpha subunit